MFIRNFILNIFILHLAGLLASCSSLPEQKPNRVPAYLAESLELDQDNKQCLEVLHELHRRLYSKNLEASLTEELPSFKKTLSKSLVNFSELGSWSFRSKKAQSIYSKLMSKKSLSISDGLGARFIVDNPTTNNMNNLFEYLLGATLSGKLRFSEIRNYRLDSGHAYFSDEQVYQLRDAASSKGLRVKIKTGKDAIREKGYVSFHMKLITDGEHQAEFQIRGKQIHELNEVDHLFYDANQGKGLAKKFNQDPEVVHLYNKFLDLNTVERSLYFDYLEEFMRFNRELEKGVVSERGPPMLPAELSHSTELVLSNVFKILSAYTY